MAQSASQAISTEVLLVTLFGILFMMLVVYAALRNDSSAVWAAVVIACVMWVADGPRWEMVPGWARLGNVFVTAGAILGAAVIAVQRWRDARREQEPPASD